MRRVNRKGDSSVSSGEGSNRHFETQASRELSEAEEQQDVDVDVTKKYAVRPISGVSVGPQWRQSKEAKFMLASLMFMLYFLYVTQYWLPSLPTSGDHALLHQQEMSTSRSRQSMPSWRRHTILLSESSDDGDRDESPPRRKSHIVRDDTVPIVLPNDLAASSQNHGERDTVDIFRDLLLPLDEEALEEAQEPDYDGLKIRFFLYDDDGPVRRYIFRSYRSEWTHEELQHWDPITLESLEDLQDDVDWYYSFDDDIKRNPLVGYDDDRIQDEKQCRRTSWHRDLNINCNSLHEFDVQYRFRSGEASFLGNGAYRYAYLSELEDDSTVIFKSYRYDYDYETKDFEYMRIDAFVADIFSSSPLTVGIHGFCGTAMINEAVIGDRMETVAMPHEHDSDEGYEHIMETIQKMKEAGDLVVLNELTGREKLYYALAMAEPLLLLHSYPGGVIVHDDITLEQYLVAEDGTIKLNDFNRAEFMLWNEKDGEYCRYRNNPGKGWWRSSEEYKDDPLNEAIDIWSLGNNFFGLLTGYSPFVELHDHLPELKNKIMDGQTAFIDPRFLNRSFGDRVLAEIIPLCWILNADERIDIFGITDSLRGHLFYDMIGMSWEVFTKENNLQENLTLQQFMEHAFNRQRLPVPIESSAAIAEAAAKFWEWLGIEF